MMKSILRLFFITIFLAIGGFYYYFSPTYASELHYNGETITIFRNENNIPNIYAPSRESYFYAIGRVHAEDRLFQMTFKRLIIQGRLSQFLGEKPLPMDKFMRELNIYGWGKQTALKLQRQNKTQYANLLAYVSSINEYANSLKTLPFDFQLIRYKWEDWTVQDVFGLFKLLEWSQSVNLPDEFTRSLLLVNHTKEEVAKLLPVTKEDWSFTSTMTIDDELIPQELRSDFMQQKIKATEFNPQILSHYNELGLLQFYKTVQGSNVWAISGKHTKSGSPILVHDPHLQNVMPSQWYQIQATYQNNGANHSISGISCTGVPFIVGKTDYLAMGITTIYMDNQDLYREKIEGDKYLVNNKWVNLKIREEKIKIKTSEGLQQETYIVRQTHRGPLIHYILSSFGSFVIQDNISIKWTGFNDEYSSIVTASLIPEIKNIQAAKSYLLLQTQFLFNVNVVMITNDGHIGYQQLGRYPIRRDPSSGLFVKDGTNTDNDWLGYVPPEHRIQIIDPPKGYIINSNNRIASEQYYDGLHRYTIFTARSDRLHEIISSEIKRGHKFDVSDMKRIVIDTVDSYCLRILPFIIESVPEAERYLKNFDCNFVKESTSAAIYQVFIYELHLAMDIFGGQKMSILSFHPYHQFLFNFIKESSKDPEKTKKLQLAWRNMWINLSTFFKTSDTTLWRWGQYHKDVMHHLPLSSSPLGFLYDRSFEGYGNIHTVNVGKMNKVGLGDFETSHRANYRAIYSFAEQSFWIIDSGSSQLLFSKFYDDQWKLFKENEFLPLAPPLVSRPSVSEL